MDSICSVIFSLVFFLFNRDLSSNNISSLPERVFLTLKTWRGCEKTEIFEDLNYK